MEGNLSRRDLITARNGAFFRRFGSGIVDQIQDQPSVRTGGNLLSRRELIGDGTAALVVGFAAGIVNETLGQPAETTITQEVNGKIIKAPEYYLKYTGLQNWIDHVSTFLVSVSMVFYAKAATVGDVPASEVIDKRTNKAMDSARKFLHIPSQGTIFPPETTLQTPGISPKTID